MLVAVLQVEAAWVWPKANGPERVASVRHKLTEPASDVRWTLLKEFPNILCGAPIAIHFLFLIVLHQIFNIFMYPADIQEVLANTDQTIIKSRLIKE